MGHWASGRQMIIRSIWSQVTGCVSFCSPCVTGVYSYSLGYAIVVETGFELGVY